jgi:hypothetical protein
LASRPADRSAAVLLWPCLDLGHRVIEVRRIRDEVYQRGT